MSIRLPNSLFVHVPRTGGLWLGETLNQLTIKKQVLKGDIDSHYRFKDFPKDWQKKLIPFSFIRHPVDWVKSRWSHVIEHSTHIDGRHEGVHSLFDELVDDSFEKTLKTIITKRPGLVSLTFSEMQNGVNHVRQTEQLPLVAFQLLEELEGVPLCVWDWIKYPNKFNSTSTLNKYEKEFEKASESLVKEFVDSELKCVSLWKAAKVKV